MRKLGPFGKLIREGGIPTPIRNDDVYLLSRAWSSPSGLVRGALFVFRTLGYYLSGQKPVGMGASLASHMMYIKNLRIKANRGVTLATGGFAHNKEWRLKYQGVPG